MSITRKRLTAALVVAGIGTFTAMHGFGRGDLPVNGAEAAIKPSAPTMEVDAATVVSKTITDYQNYSGRLEAVEKVEIRPLVPGTIVAMHFVDGALVKKGDPLGSVAVRRLSPTKAIS
jgi:multidrug efflux system membrane fusion protein